MDFELFTNEQKAIHIKIHSLEEKLMQSIDPSTFVLNPKTLAIRQRIEEVQSQCPHIWENGACVVCGKEESNK